MKRWVKTSVGAALLLLFAAAVLWALNTQDEAAWVSADTPASTLTASATPDALTRGAYLAKAGNCAGCHTVRGGAPYAGGLRIATPFGPVYASNLTPDMTTGIGRWSSADFWRALHNGRSKDGRLLYPAFPYTSYTQVSREDADALLAFLKSQRPVVQANTPHAVRFPYNSQLALAVWRALYFGPKTFQPDAKQGPDYNRGAYLVNGLGHCSACHSARNAMGASSGLHLAGGLIPVQNWYAPSLVSPLEAGIDKLGVADMVAVLKTGVSSRASVMGPMAEVVLGSTQHLSEADLNAMALYLKALGENQIQSQTPAMATTDLKISVMGTTPTPQALSVPPAVAAYGAQLYEQHCAQCHGAQGQGQRLGNLNAYPALAGNRAVLMPQTANLVQIVLNGGYAPATSGNPRPFGMPPFVMVLEDADIAAVLTHVRRSWGNQAEVVSPLDVNRVRANQVP